MDGKNADERRFMLEEQYAMFSVTPVDNQFILEYLPGAKGDDVRVYLYGLMQCYQPQEEMTVERMAQELDMTPEDVIAAYSRWERKGLVHRISDNPPRYRYVSALRFFVSGEKPPRDLAYEDFAEKLHAVFGGDRLLHGAEVRRCYEWVEDLRLPPEVVLQLMAHMVALHGKGVSIKRAEPLALTLAAEKAVTAEAAELVLSRDEVIWNGCKQVLRRFGKTRNPSQDEEALYRTWVVDWGFQPEAILDACAETVSGDPNFKYLNGILKRHHEQYAASKVTGKEMRQRRETEKTEAEPVKALLHALGADVAVTEGIRSAYQELRALYPDEIILMAGHECARHGRKFDDVLPTLKNWKREGLETPEAITAYMKKIDEQNDFVWRLFSFWGVKEAPKSADRRRAVKWRDEWGLSEAFIVFCAKYAAEASKPMGYLDKILESFRQKGILTPEAAEASWAANPLPKPRKMLSEQQYSQREYVDNTDDVLDQMMARWQEGGGDAK